MTDKDDPFYQPWQEDAANFPPKRMFPPVEPGLAKPEEPPLGIDVARYVDQQKMPHTDAQAPSSAAPDGTATDALKKAGAEAGKAAKLLGTAARAGANKAGAAIVAADMPGKIARLELGAKAKAGAKVAGDYMEQAGKSVASASRSIASRSKSAVESGADRLAPKLSDAAHATQHAARKLAHDAKTGVQRGAAAIKARTAADPIERPSSALDDLVQHEGLDPIAIEGAGPRASQPVAGAQSGAPSGTRDAGLPLFGDGPVFGKSSPDADVAQYVAEPAVIPTAAAAPKAAPVASATPSASAATSLAAPEAQHADARPGQSLPRAAAADAAAVGIPWLRRPDWMTPQMAYASVLAIALALAFAFGMMWQSSRTDAAIRDYLLSNPEILPAAMAVYDGRQKASAIGKVREPLERAFSGAWAGNANGDVTMVVFTDYACVFCRKATPDLARLLREDTGLKIVFRELPIIAPISETAAREALAVARQGKYMAYHNSIMAAPTVSDAAMKAALVASGADQANVASAVKSDAITQELNSNLALARGLGISGTPVTIVGDTLLDGAVGYAKLKDAVAKARGAR